MGKSPRPLEEAKTGSESGIEENAPRVVAKSGLSTFVYTLDTNAILYYLKDDAETVSLLRNIFAENAPVNISAITELELFAFSKLTAHEEALIEDLISTLAVIPVDSHVARLAAFVRRQYHLKVPDSVIAATALFTGSTLLTRNTRDFRGVTHLKVRKV